MGKKRTKAQKRFIREKYQELSVEEIAQRLKVKPEMVRQMIKDLGLEFNKPQNPFFKKIEEFSNRYAARIVLIITTGYILFFSTVSILRYSAFNFNDFDLAIHAQTVWNMLHGSIDSPILGIPFLGNHLNFILFLVIPVYAIFSTPLTLLLLQTLLIGLGVVPVYLLAREALDKKFTILFSLSYLIYPALNFVNNFEFHPVAFSIPFLLFMIYYFEKARFIPFLAFMFLSLLCKENIALGVFFFGLYVLFFTPRGWKWSIIPLGVAVLWLGCALKIMPYFNQETISFSFLYRHLGDTIPQVVSNIFEHPGIMLKLVFTRINMKFLFQLLLPLAFLSLLSPKILFIATPFFLQQLLSQRSTDHTIYFHYTAKLIPFLFISAIYGLRFLLKARFMNRHQWSLLGVLLTVSIVSNLCFGLLPKMPARFSSRYAREAIDYKKQDFINRIPKDASVVATFEFLPKLSQREKVYSFHHVYIGKYTLSNKRYVLPQEVEYALIDFDDHLMFSSFYRPARYQNLQNFFAEGEWGLVMAANNIGLFKKGYKTDERLWQKLGEVTPLSSARFVVEDNIVAQGYYIENKRVKRGGIIKLSFIWECLQETAKDYWVAFRLTDKEGEVIHKFNHPIGYRIYPTYSWKKGEVLKEDYRILVPAKIKAKEALLKMGFFSRSGTKGGITKGVPVRVNISGMFDPEGWINLGKIEIVNQRNEIRD